jgi:hypothetical protein
MDANSARDICSQQLLRARDWVWRVQFRGGHRMKEIRLMDNAEFIEILLRYRGLKN